jgi:hypothetical protein
MNVVWGVWQQNLEVTKILIIEILCYVCFPGYHNCVYQDYINSSVFKRHELHMDKNQRNSMLKLKTTYIMMLDLFNYELNP